MAAVQKGIVRIPDDLYGRIVGRVEESKGEFKSADEYVEFILREIFANDTSESFSKSDEDQVKERLKSLGYI